MKTKRLNWLAMTVVLIAISGCSTTNIQPKKTSDDCLVLIRTTLTNNDNVPTARSYYFKLSNGATITASNKAEDFMSILIREPGIKITKVSSRITDTEVTGERTNLPFDFVLPYKPGQIVIADFTFAQTLRKIDNLNFNSSFDLPAISDESRESLLESVKKSRTASSWF